MEFIYMNENEINPLLKCSVCQYPFTNPVYIPARDIRLCRLCIPKAPVLMNIKTDDFSSIGGNIVHMNDQLLLQLLDELPVQCIACKKENIFRKDFTNHRLHDCPKRIVQCKASDLKCSWTGAYEEYDEHIRNCPFEFLRPILVDSLAYRKQIEKYDEILSAQQNEIEQLKNQNQQSTVTVEDNRIEQLQSQVDKYVELFSNQQNEIEQLKNQNQQLNVEDSRIEQLQSQVDKYVELVSNQQNEIEQLKNQNQQSTVTVEDNRIEQLQNQIDKYVKLFSNQRNEIEQLQSQIDKYVELFSNQQNEIEQLKNQPSNVEDNRIEELQSQIDKYVQLFSNQRNEIKELKKQNQQSTTDNNQIEQLKNQLEKYDELFTSQQNQIQQLTTQVEQCDRRLNTLQASFRILLQEPQKRARDRESQESVSLQKTQADDIQQLKDQYQQLKDQFEQSIVQVKPSSDNTEIIDKLKEQLNQFTIDLKQIQERYTHTINQLKQIQNQDSHRKNELSYLRQCRDKQEIQICLLSRKKSVVPRSYATIDAKTEDLIKAYQKNSDINLSNKHFDNQDLETICKRTMFDKQCRKLRLENNDINAKGATVIADHLHGNLTLSELYLSENFISDIGTHALAQVLAINNYTLTWLELHSNNIGDEGAEYLAEMLKTNKTLNLLGLNSNKITNRGAQILAGAITYYNETLQWLLLALNKGITDESIESFNDMFVNNSSLQAFWLKDCGLSKDGIRSLEEAAASKTNFLFEV